MLSQPGYFFVLFWNLTFKVFNFLFYFKSDDELFRIYKLVTWLITQFNIIERGSHQWSTTNIS